MTETLARKHVEQVPQAHGFRVDSLAGRAIASWAAAADPGIRESGGGLELRYGLSTLDDTQWTSVTVEGTQTQVLLNAVRPGTIILAKIRGFKVTPGGVARGRWSLPVAHKVGVGAILVDTPQVVAGAVSTVGGSAYSYPTTTIGASDTSKSTTLDTVMTVTTAGESMDVDGYVKVEALVNNTSVAYFDYTVDLYIDAALKRTISGRTNSYAILGGQAVAITVPVAHREVLSAASHGFKVQITTAFRDASANLVVASGGTLFPTAYLKVLESKR